MTKKIKKPQLIQTSSAFYYLARALQRIALCLTIGLTGVYWVTLITGLNNVIQNETPWLTASGLKSHALLWAVLSIGVSLALFSIPRFRKYDKPLIVDGVVIAAFCLLSVLVAQSLVYTPY